MQALLQLLSFQKGYRTYAASAAAILAAVATFAGWLSPNHGVEITAAALALSQVFQRMALADHQLSLQDLTDAVNAVKPLTDPKKEPPATIPFNSAS